MKMKSYMLRLNNDGSSTVPLDKLMLDWPDRHRLLCAIAGQLSSTEPGALSLAGDVAERDPAAGRQFVAYLERILLLEKRRSNRILLEMYLAPVSAGIARAVAHELLKEIE